MTGFGRSERQGKNYKLCVEIKSVNHRFGDIMVHLPKLFYVMEDDLKKIVFKSLARGKIDLFVSFEEHVVRKKNLRIDRNMAIAYHEALQELSQILGIPAPQSVHEIAQYPDVISLDEEMPEAEFFKETLYQATEEAVEHLLTMRYAEGRHILEDLTRRINILEDYVDAIEKRAPEIVTLYRMRLQAKIREILSVEDVDEARLLQEVLLFSDRVNLTEELVRLRSHFKQFITALEQDEMAIGRKLDFIVQEINRETNTIASKANDTEVVAIAVELKSEIEKIREQVQNIE